LRASEVLQRLRAETERLRELVSRDPKKLSSVCCPADPVLVSLAFVGTPLVARQGSSLNNVVAPES